MALRKRLQIQGIYFIYKRNQIYIYNLMFNLMAILVTTKKIMFQQFISPKFEYVSITLVWKFLFWKFRTNYIIFLH